MATFPTLTPSSRTFTPGRHPHSEIPTLNGLQTRVMTSNVILEQQLRLTFVGLTEAQMLSVRSHYIGQQGRFLSFAIPDALLSGMTTPSYFTPTGYSWIYGGPPQVEDIAGTQRYTVSIELVTVPPEGANVNGAELGIVANIAAGIASATIEVTGATLTVAASIVGGVVADNTSAGVDLTVSVSFAAGSADPGGGGGDPNFNSVSLLLHMDGSNGSTTFTDTSSISHTVTVGENAQVTTTSPKFGTGALLCDGSGDYLSVPSHTSLTFGTGDFTIEAWLRFGTLSTAGYIFSQRLTSGFSLQVLADGRLNAITPSVNSLTENTVLMVANTWYHVALTRSGTTIKIWVDGVERNTTTNSENGLSGTSYVGAGTVGSGSVLNGRIDDLRITKGVCRYTATFTPPTAAFPDA